MRLILVVAFVALAPNRIIAAAFTGVIVDAESGEPLAARVYLQSKSGWHFVRSTHNEGSAVLYQKQRAEGRSVEMHTTVSPHPFVSDLPPGSYTMTVERGKEYLPATEQLTIADRPVETTVRLQRWVDMAARGWYSGDTHVHRRLDELPNVVLAEDLNVALPLTGWVTEGFASPQPSYAQETGRVETALIEVDKTHVIYPLNTEWEIFTIGGRRHALGAVFALGHSRPFRLGAPPVLPIAEEAHRQGALLELDKHNWPWSMMLVPVMGVDLFELTNNHIWRTAFAFEGFYPEYVAEYMKLAMKDGRFTERSWIEFGFQNYYTLLNCGFRVRPTAGTASGVHPVPLGFGRVYVELPDGFSYKKWMQGLDAGRSFVTTGPMLLVTANGRPAGHSFNVADGEPQCHLTGLVLSPVRISRLEVVVNGEIRSTELPKARRGASPAHGSGQAFDLPIDIEVELEGSSWVAVRCFYETEGGRPRFAHSSPFFFDVPGKPLRPRKVETAYLIRRVKDELSRHRDVLPAAALDEYQTALKIYEKLHATAR